MSARFAALLLLAASLPGVLSAQADSARTTIGGYGEVHYSNSSTAGSPGQVNLARFVVFIGHNFNERLSLRSELEVEDAKIAGGESGGEVALEQAYLDYRFSAPFTLRAGLFLLPIGIVNETHEPPTFNGVSRPSFDEVILPVTWREIGIGALGAVPGIEGLRYRAYIVNGLLASGFDAESGIRGGRQEGRQASFANPALTGRLEWSRPGLKLGGSVYYGGTANGDSSLGTGTFAAPVTLLAADARYDIGAFAFRAEAANLSVRDAGRINSTFGNGVGKRIAGWYAEGACNLLRLLAPASAQALNGFVRYERYDTQAVVAAGTIRDLTLARRITTFGLTYKPLWNVAFKADYQLRRNRAHTAEDEVFALGLGYQF
ncbi:MAG: hypothetical protein ABI742_05635 [Gemmatimonadota bacterium]